MVSELFLCDSCVSSDDSYGAMHSPMLPMMVLFMVATRNCGEEKSTGLSVDVPVVSSQYEPADLKFMRKREMRIDWTLRTCISVRARRRDRGNVRLDDELYGLKVDESRL